MSDETRQSWVFTVEAEMTKPRAALFGLMLSNWAFGVEWPGEDFAVSMEPREQHPTSPENPLEGPESEIERSQDHMDVVTPVEAESDTEREAT